MTLVCRARQITLQCTRVGLHGNARIVAHRINKILTVNNSEFDVLDAVFNRFINSRLEAAAKRSPVVCVHSKFDHLDILVKIGVIRKLEKVFVGILSEPVFWDDIFNLKCERGEGKHRTPPRLRFGLVCFMINGKDSGKDDHTYTYGSLRLYLAFYSFW